MNSNAINTDIGRRSPNNGKQKVMQEEKKKYSQISYEARRLFIEKVLSRDMTIKEAAKQQGIKFSTGKAILQVYKNERRIGKKPNRQKRKIHQSDPKAAWMRGTGDVIKTDVIDGSIDDTTLQPDQEQAMNELDLSLQGLLQIAKLDLSKMRSSIQRGLFGYLFRKTQNCSAIDVLYQTGRTSLPGAYDPSEIKASIDTIRSQTMDQGRNRLQDPNMIIDEYSSRNSWIRIGQSADHSDNLFNDAPAGPQRVRQSQALSILMNNPINGRPPLITQPLPQIDITRLLDTIPDDFSTRLPNQFGGYEDNYMPDMMHPQQPTYYW